MLQTVYREIDFDDEITARQQRDAHLAELQARGMECIAEDLYNVIEGWRVFTLVATLPARPDTKAASRLSKPSQSGAVEPPTRSNPPKRQGSIPQKPYSKRVKPTYEVR